jgi:hypothetical protein
LNHNGMALRPVIVIARRPHKMKPNAGTNKREGRRLTTTHSKELHVQLGDEELASGD